MNPSFDVAIVGGGVMGSAIAFFLTRHPGFGGRIVVVERDSTYERSSTAVSVASIRQQFSTPLNIRMSRFGFAFLKGLPDEFGPDADVGLKERGYLFLAGPSGEAVLRSNRDIQLAEGADIAWLEPDDLTRRFPWMATDGVAAACLGLSGEGWLDPHTLLRTLRRQARNSGAVYEEAEAVGIERDGNSVTAVELADGRRLACGQCVNAAGPAAGTVAGWAGVELPVEPRKRFVYVIDCRDKAQVTDCPMVIDTSGVYFRPEGEFFLCGVSPPEDREPPIGDFEVDYSLFEDTIWPALARRVPVFEAVKPVNAWAGYYAYNTLDQNAVLGRHLEVSNFLFANGFSGHGLQQAPAVGRGLAELIVDGRYTTLDLSDLGYERVAANRPLAEVNVI